MSGYLTEQQAKLGQEIGISDWIELTQEMVNQFADLTMDPQFIHVDPVRAKAETPFGGTIVHGFFVLSLTVHMAEDCMPPHPDHKMLLNYGFDKVRFIRPVPVGSRVRGRFTLNAISEKNPGQFLSTYGLSIEIDDEDSKPALVAEWLGMALA